MKLYVPLRPWRVVDIFSMMRLRGREELRDCATLIGASEVTS